MCAGSLAGVTYLRYAVLRSPKYDETAVYCFDPAISVLLMLVPGNVFHVQPYNLLFVYVDGVYSMRSLAVSGFLFIFPSLKYTRKQV